MAQIILEDLSAKADPKTQETRRLDSFRMLLHAALNAARSTFWTC